MAVESPLTEKVYQPGSAMVAEPLTGIVYRSPNDIVVELWKHGGTVGRVLTRDHDYALNGDGLAGAGTIRALAVHADDDQFRIRREAQPLQKRVLPVQQPLQAKALESGLDDLTLRQQEQLRELGRTARAPRGEVGPLIEPQALRANKISLWSAAGDMLKSISTGALALLMVTDMAAALPPYFKGDPGGNTMAIGAAIALPGLNIPLGTDQVETSCYRPGARLTGKATYVCDELANAALMAAHPDCCFLTRNGRFFRLADDKQGYITPEQVGCPVPASAFNEETEQSLVDARPHIEATTHYATAIGAAVGLTQPNYDLWAAPRTFGLTMEKDQHGSYVRYRGTTKIVGLASSAVMLRYLNSEGGRNDIETQVGDIPDYHSGMEGQYQPGQVPWLGHGFAPDYDYVDEANPGAFFHMENVVLDGTRKYDPNISQGTPGVVNLTHKALMLQDHVRRVYMRGVRAINWAAEIYYTAGSSTLMEEYLENCEFRGSPQCAFNPQTAARGTYVNVTCADSYQNEIIGGLGKTFIGGLWENLKGAAVMGGAAGIGRFEHGYPAGYPLRTYDAAPYITFQDLQIKNCGPIELGSYMRGRILNFDSTIFLTHRFGRLEDIQLTVEAMLDKREVADAVAISGPESRTQQVPGAAPGINFDLPRNIDVTVNVNRSRQAQDQPVPGDGEPRLAWNSAVAVAGGLMEGARIKFTIDGIANDAVDLRRERITPGTILPTFNIRSSFKRANPQFAPRAFTAPNQPGETRIPVLTGENAIFLEGAPGPRYVRFLDQTWNWPDGAEATFVIDIAPNDGVGNGRTVAIFNSPGNGYLVPETRLLGRAGDRITFRWDATRNIWREVAYASNTPVRIAGSGNLPARSIAAGATVNLDLAVPDVRASNGRNDLVEWIQHQPGSMQGLVTDAAIYGDGIVTVALTNPGAAAVDFPGSSSKLRVLHGYAA